MPAVFFSEVFDIVNGRYRGAHFIRNFTRSRTSYSVDNLLRLCLVSNEYFVVGIHTLYGILMLKISMNVYQRGQTEPMVAKQKAKDVGTVAVSEEAEVTHDESTVASQTVAEIAPVVSTPKASIAPDEKDATEARQDDTIVNGDESTGAKDANEDEAMPAETKNATDDAPEIDNIPANPGHYGDDTSDELNVPQNAVASDASHRKRGVVLTGIVLTVLAVGFGVYLLAFARGAQPGVQVAGLSVTGKNETEITRLAQAQADKIRITLKTAQKSDTTKPSVAGITFDARKTADGALNAKRGLLDRLMFWKTQNVPLEYAINRTALDAYLEKNVITGWKLPKDAGLAFNPETKQYDIVAPVPGEGVQMWQVTKALDKASLAPQTVVADIKPVPTAPAITTAVAQRAQTKANGFLKSDIKMLQNGTRVFYLEPREIDTLLDIIPNTEKGTLEVSVNPDRVQKFVDTDITSTIAKPAREKVVIVNPETGQETVLQEGTAGQKLAGNKKLASEIAVALREGKAYAQEISVEGGGEVPTKRFTGKTRWAEVDLTKQMAYMRLDDQTIMSFRISSGRAVTPTDPGEWNVYGKLPLRTMRGTINGESYEVPNVPWVVYFHDGEALHGTYWHNNFGTPMSHGCINMTIADAKLMYNFAYIGMRVSVHY